MTHLPQKNVNSIPGKSCSNPRFTDFEGKKSRELFFFSRSQTHHETSELRNSSERPRKFPKIFGHSRIIFENSDNLQDKNLHAFGSAKVGRNMMLCDKLDRGLKREKFAKKQKNTSKERL